MAASAHAHWSSARRPWAEGARPTINEPIDALIVSTWYPSVDDTIAGRFVADQVAALAASGRVRPSVVSFDPATIVGSGRFRDASAMATMGIAERALATRPDVFQPVVDAVAGSVETARLSMPVGRFPAAGPASAAVARQRVLGALADRWLRDPGALRAPRPAIVNAHTAYPDGAGATDLAARLGVPLVITEHSSVVDRSLAVEEVAERYRAAARQAARFIAVSRTLAGELERQVPGLAGRIAVVPNAVDTESFQAAGHSAGARTEVLYVGYRKPSKGIGNLLEAFALVHAARPGVRLRLVGGSPTAAIEADWLRQIERLGLAGSVLLDGPANRAGVAAALNGAALFVHPSPRETFGVVAAEALSAGVPVVATDSGGVTEILGSEPGRFGALVPAEDPSALAAAIAQTLDRLETFDPAMLRAWVVQRYGARAVAAILADLYAEVIAEAGAAARSTNPGGSRANSRAPHPSESAGPASPDCESGRSALSVVVALDGRRAEALGSISAAARRRLVVVVASGSTLLDGFAGTVEARVGALVSSISDSTALGPRAEGWRRLARAVRHPLAVARRRGLIPGQELLLRRRASAAVIEALTLARSLDPSGSPIDVICLDGTDYLVARDALAATSASTCVAPGGLRWLADRAATGAGGER